MDTKIFGISKNKERQKQLINDLREIPDLCGNKIRGESIKTINECADLLEILTELKPVRKPEDFWDE